MWKHGITMIFIAVLLAAASASYLGKNTRGMTTIDLRENDPRVLEMKNMR